MQRVITFDKGSKRRLKQIRWKLLEVVSLALIALFLLAGSILIMFWELEHERLRLEPTKAPKSGVRSRKNPRTEESFRFREG